VRHAKGCHGRTRRLATATRDRRRATTRLKRRYSYYRCLRYQCTYRFHGRRASQARSTVRHAKGCHGRTRRLGRATRDRRRATTRLKRARTWTTRLRGSRRFSKSRAHRSTRRIACKNTICICRSRFLWSRAWRHCSTMRSSPTR